MMRVFVAMLAFAAIAGAQSITVPPDTAPLPRELAAAMVSTAFSPRAGAVMAGKAPSNFPMAVVPKGELLGGTKDRVFLRTPDDRAVAVAALVAQAQRDGFTPALQRVERSGFATAPPSQTIASSGTLCRDTLFLGYASAVRSGGGAYLSVTVQPVNEYSVCSPRNVERIMRDMEQTPPEMPLLYPPDGLRNRSGSSGGNSSSGFYASSVYDGPGVYTDSVMFVYTAQLKQQGWSAIQLLGGGEYASLSATKPGQRGRTIRLLVVDMRSDQRLHFITMQAVIAR